MMSGLELHFGNKYTILHNPVFHLNIKTVANNIFLKKMSNIYIRNAPHMHLPNNKYLS